MTALAGTVFFTANGEQFSLRANLTYWIGDVDREAVVGLDGVHGFMEKPMVPWVEGDISDRADLSLPSLEAMTDVTVTIELINGKTYVWRNAWCTGIPEMNASEGSGTIRFEAFSAEEIT